MKVIRGRIQSEEQFENAGTLIPAAQTEALEAGSAEELIAEFEDENGMVVHEVEVLGRKFFIRELDVMAMLDVETQRLSVERGQIVRKPNREAKLGLSLEFQSTIMRKTSEGYVPMFDLQNVQQFLSKPKAKPLINALADAIYSINPELSPSKKVKAANALGV